MQQKKMNWKTILALGVIGIVIIFCGCGFLALLVSNDTDSTAKTDNTRVAEVQFTATIEEINTKAQEEAHATDVAAMVEATFAAINEQATATADAAPTTGPTATSEPTETAGPTNTPKPTATPKPTIDLAEVAYMAEISTMSQDCYGSFMDIASQSQKAGEDFTLMLDTNWKVDTAIALAGVETHCVGMRDISPVPPRFATLHGYVNQMASEMQQMVDDYAYGVDHLDADRLMSAVEHMEKGTEYVDLMSAEIERLNK